MTEQPQQVFGLTPDEVALVRRAAVLAGATVAIAKYSGASGTRIEFDAILRGLEQAVLRYPDNPLVGALLSPETQADVNDLAPTFRDAPTQRSYSDFELAAMNRCSQAAEVLNLKAPAEQAEQVRAAIVSMCEHVAQASKEGTTFGLGGTRVDARETAVVDRVRRALAGE